MVIDAIEKNDGSAKAMDMMENFVFGGGIQIMFALVFILIFIMSIVSIIKGIGQWNRNNHSPRLTVDAKIVTKRTNVQHYTHHQDNGVMHMTNTTSYYVTFQVESGDRMELQVNGREYGMLVEGDRGKLSFQGTRYLGFEKK